MSQTIIILLIILVVLAAVLVALYFFGKKRMDKQQEQEAQIMAARQPVSMLIIDKKRMKLKDSGLPEAVIAQTPWYMKRSKLPMVKAKVGPQIMTLICDERIFDDVPVKKEVKAEVSGLYIVAVRGLHGKNAPKPQVKKGFWKRLMDTAREKAGANPLK